MRPFRTVLASLALLLAFCAAAGRAEAALKMMETYPRGHAVMTDANQQFFVRFDGPVDHQAARLTILRDGTVVRELRARLQSQPNILFAVVGPLAPGAYVLRWHAQAVGRPDERDGEVTFSVRAP
jgi:methionine-rich copper-binding protein CopC